ncbi:MAG: hypothetical protein M1823_007135, partial [Watsoniomyces obsoletus]
LADCPILVFLYGGGLVTGSKISPLVENELVYANLGHHFAETHGFIVVVADYRLVPQARFPSGGEDLALAIEWVRSNVKELGGSEEPRDLFLMGNSAGGVHVSTYLFSRVFAESRKHILKQEVESVLRLRGAILLSVPCHFRASEGSRADVLKTYYGDRTFEDSPLGLLESLQERISISESLPGVSFLILTTTLDPEDEIVLPNRHFLTAWEADNSSAESSLQKGVVFRFPTFVTL